MKTHLQQSQEANAKRVFGFQSGTASHDILHFLRANPGQSFSSYEVAAVLGLSVSRVAWALTEGKKLGAFSGHRDIARCTRTMFYAFKAMPTKPATPAKPSGGKRHDWAMSEILATRAIKREEEAALRASNATKADVIIPAGLVVKVAPTPPNMGNLCYVDPSKVERYFVSMPLGATLEAA